MIESLYYKIKNNYKYSKIFVILIKKNNKINNLIIATNNGN